MSQPNILAPNQIAFTKSPGAPPFSNLSNVAPGGNHPSSHCLFYFVYLDEFNHPIPGTMFSKNNNKVQGCNQKIARLTGSVMTPTSGQIQCFSKNGLRYWYQVKSVPTGSGSAKNVIVPNSMIAVKGVPKENGTNSAGITGPGRSCRYVEYKIFKTTDGL